MTWIPQVCSRVAADASEHVGDDAGRPQAHGIVAAKAREIDAVGTAAFGRSCIQRVSARVCHARAACITLIQ